MDLAQRLPKAALVTFLSLLLFGSGVGFVSAAGSDNSIPETMQLPALQEGDEWSYVMDYVWHEGDEVEAGQDIMAFTWEEAAIVYDDKGQPHHVQTLSNPLGPEAVFIDHTTRRVVAEKIDYNATESWNGAGRIPLAGGGFIYAGPLFQTETEVNVTGHWIFYGDNPGPCGFFTAMHEGPVDLSGPVPVHGECVLDDEGDDVTQFRAFESRSINGIPTIGFQANNAYGETRLWYNPAIPYPVAMEMTVTGFVMEIAIGSDNMEFEFNLEAGGVLQHFKPGAEAWGEPEGPLPPPLTPVDLVPPTVISVDDTGIDHPFKLSEAFSGAMADPLFDDLRNYMEENPDARAVIAKGWNNEDDSHFIHHWTFRMWSEEGGALDVEAERRIAKPGTPEEIVQQVTGPDEYYGDGSGAFNVFNLDFTVTTRDRIPDVVPDLADAFKRFEQGTGLVPNRYGFDYTCQLFCWGDEVVALDVHHDFDATTDADVITGTPGEVKALRQSYVFNSDGHLISELRSEREGTTRSSSVLEGGAGAMRPDAAAAPEIETGRNGVWIAPSPQAAAGVTFVAFLVGAAYWLWPVIKSAGFMGLFSRLSSDQLLEHPVRSGIFETVQAQPGIHYQGLIREVGKGRGVVEHHLRKLQQGGYVVSQSNGGHTCFFPKGIADHRIMAAVPVLKTQGAARVLRHILGHPETTVSEVAAQLGVAKSTASHHVRRLRQAGLLEAGSLRPTPGARKALTLAA